MSGEFTIYYRNLPHWRQKGAVYFVTWRLHRSQAPLTPDERTIVMNALDFFNKQRYVLFIYVVMDDHVHAILQPLEDRPLQTILHSWKSFTANQMHKSGNRERSLWQADSYCRIMRDDKELIEKMKYTADNPIRRWPDIQDYPWMRMNFN